MMKKMGYILFGKVLIREPIVSPHADKISFIVSL